MKGVPVLAFVSWIYAQTTTTTTKPGGAVDTTRKTTNFLWNYVAGIVHNIGKADGWTVGWAIIGLILALVSISYAEIKGSVVGKLASVILGAPGGFWAGWSICCWKRGKGKFFALLPGDSGTITHHITKDPLAFVFGVVGIVLAGWAIQWTSFKGKVSGVVLLIAFFFGASFMFDLIRGAINAAH